MWRAPLSVSSGPSPSCGSAKQQPDANHYRHGAVIVRIIALATMYTPHTGMEPVPLSSDESRHDGRRQPGSTDPRAQEIRRRSGEVVHLITWNIPSISKHALVRHHLDVHGRRLESCAVTQVPRSLAHAGDLQRDPGKPGFV